jgi:hypothetical protein
VLRHPEAGRTPLKTHAAPLRNRRQTGAAPLPALRATPTADKADGSAYLEAKRPP